MAQGTEQLLAVVTTILGGGTLTAAVTWYAAHRQAKHRDREVEMEGDVRIVETARGMLTDIRAELDHQRDRLTKAEGRIDELLAENRQLRRDLAHLERENAALRGRLEG